MENEYIYADWTECENYTQSKNKNVMIFSEPLSAIVSSICSGADNIMNAVKEYSMCRQ